MYVLVVSLVCLLPVVWSQDGSRSCFACASPSLQSRWYLTGLPRIPETNFRDCSDTNNGNIGMEQCSGACFTMIFDDPDKHASPTENQVTLVVRGCHSTLMQVVADRNGNNNQYCELDTTYPMSNSRGTIVTGNMLINFCSSDKCNVRKDYLSCSQQTTNLLNNRPLPCYECTPKEGKNCKESKCAKKYCMKQTVKLNGGYQLTKTCSNVNIYGIDNYCSNNDVITTPGGVPVKSFYSQCMCKDKEYCNNSSIYSTFFISLLTFAFSCYTACH